MSIYRHILKGRPVKNLASLVRIREVEPELNELYSAVKSGAVPHLAERMGGMGQIRVAYDRIGEAFSTEELDAAQGAIREAVPVDISGVLPRDTGAWPPIERNACPWPLTWIEDFDLQLGILSATAKDDMSTTATLDIFVKSGGQVCYGGQESISFSDDGQAMVADGVVMGADMLATTFGIHSYIAKLLSCRNVKTPTKQQRWPKRSRKAAKSRKGIEWRVVEITRSGVTRRIGGGGSGPRNEARWHTVAGHFKTYTDDAPLLGRATGTFWWGSFARGNPERGELRKIFSDHADTPLLADAIEATK